MTDKDNTGLRPRGESDPRVEAEPALCPQCGGEVPVMEALVYHGLVYHPVCVLGGSGQRATGNGEGGRPGTS